MGYSRIMGYNRSEIPYDNRFGFAKYATAYWRFDENRVGEQFIFHLRNGIKVSVIRATDWDYTSANEGLSCGSSIGFFAGLYEALVSDEADETLEQEGFLNHKEVQLLLSRWNSHN